MKKAFSALAKYIRNLRMQKKFSMQEVADLLYTSSAFISNLENCRASFPKESTFLRVVNVLGGDEIDAKAKYAAWKAVSIIEDSNLDKMSELEFAQIFIETICATLPEKFELRFMREVVDKNDNVWDFAIELKRVHKKGSGMKNTRSHNPVILEDLSRKEPNIEKGSTSKS